MTNSSIGQYRITDFENMPIWLQRSWSIFDRVYIQESFQKDIEATRHRLIGDSKQLATEKIRIMTQYGLGQDHAVAIEHMLVQPGASKDDLLNNLTPPMRLINHGTKEILPSKNPSKEYEDNQRLDELWLKQRGIRLSEAAGSTYLLIPPGSTQEEVIDFLKRNYTEAKSMINSGSMHFENERQTKSRIRKVSSNEIVDQRIFDLRTSGVKPKDISVYLEKEFDLELTDAEVNKRLNAFKRRKSRI